MLNFYFVLAKAAELMKIVTVMMTRLLMILVSEEWQEPEKAKLLTEDVHYS